MRFLVIAFAVVAFVGAATLPADYLPPVVDNSLPVKEYLAPTADAADDQTALADDGYRYKTVRRLKLRHRRDVNELPQNEYLPPAEEVQENATVETAPPAEEVQTKLADDGYRYKTIRRLKYRKRRDVNEVPQNEYIPPVQDVQETVLLEAAEPAAKEQTKLGDDGYRYKVVRRLKYRKRRDVDEIPQNEYLPPAQEAQKAEESVVIESSEPAAEDQTVLADDGYRYKVVRRLKYRKRRDVDEIPHKEYLPPVQEAEETVVAEVSEPAAEDQTVLADDGYRYKVVRRLKYRKRRDVDEIPQNEYLPPAQEAQKAEESVVIESSEPAAEDQTVLAGDGYRYKVVRRLKYRKRRDVDEIPQNEYLPPVQEAEETVVAEVSEPAAEDQTVLADDGYRYKVVRRLKYRKRRDVDEIPQNEYLPPAQEAQKAEESVVIESSEPAAEDQTVLADDGYRYKVVRRLKYRKRRDVDEIPQNEYLPPVEKVEETAVAEVSEPAAEDQTVLADDGYRYKVVRRLKYRKRRDVDEIPQNEYLPPAQEAQKAEESVVIESSEPAAEDQTVLADDGYRYKVVRRLKYRKRRDVDEIPQNEYLPPAQEAQKAEESVVIESSEPAAEDQTALADDGYRYKVVRRLKYRKRRDVDEIPQNDYLPPAEEVEETAVAEAPEQAQAQEEATVLADDGYRYKLVRRLKYRQRRDVNELPANEYLPSTEEGQKEPEEKMTARVADGYRYKTVRRLKYRRH